MILDIDVQGAAQIRRACPDGLTIFLETPPGEFERRLRLRDTEDEQAIRKRVEAAQHELQQASEFDIRLMNDAIGRAARELTAIIRRQFEDTIHGR